MRKLLPLLVLVSTFHMATADEIDSRTAKKALFKPKGADVETIAQPFLSDDDLKLLVAVGEQQKYYGAIAIAPSEGLMSEATVAAANFHSVDPAKTFALNGCNAARSGGEECVIVALIRPKGWRDTGFSLSLDATQDFRKEFRGGAKPRAFAISQASGEYAFSKGGAAGDAALAACNALASAKGTDDCEIVIRDE